MDNVYHHDDLSDEAMSDLSQSQNDDKDPDFDPNACHHTESDPDSEDILSNDFKVGTILYKFG